MIAGIFIAVGYAALIYEFGWVGVAVVLAHVGIMLAAAWRR